MRTLLLILSLAFGATPAYAMRDQQKVEGTQSGLEEIKEAFLRSIPSDLKGVGAPLVRAIFPPTISTAAGLEEGEKRYEIRPFAPPGWVNSRLRSQREIQRELQFEADRAVSFRASLRAGLSRYRDGYRALRAGRYLDARIAYGDAHRELFAAAGLIPYRRRDQEAYDQGVRRMLRGDAQRALQAIQYAKQRQEEAEQDRTQSGLEEVAEIHDLSLRIVERLQKSQQRPRVHRVPADHPLADSVTAVTDLETAMEFLRNRDSGYVRFLPGPRGDPGDLLVGELTGKPNPVLLANLIWEAKALLYPPEALISAVGPTAGLEEGNVEAARGQLLEFIANPTIQGVMQTLAGTRSTPDEVIDLTQYFSERIDQEELRQAGFALGLAQMVPPALYRSAQSPAPSLDVYVDEDAEWADQVKEQLRKDPRIYLVDRDESSGADIVISNRDVRFHKGRQILIHVDSTRAAAALQPGLLIHLERQGLLAVQGGVIFLHSGDFSGDVVLFA